VEVLIDKFNFSSKNLSTNFVMIFRKFLKFIKSLEHSSSSLEAETDIERSELKGLAKADYQSIFQK